MSRPRRNLYRKKLNDLLGCADDEAFFQMVWAVDALQSQRSQVASQYLHFPTEAATPEIGSSYAIHDWELESLLGQHLLAPRLRPQNRRRRVLDCTQFHAAAVAATQLRELEDAESGLYLRRFSVLNEVHRIGHRQFPWQRGYFNRPQFYRYARIYGQGDCAAYFEDVHGITMNDISMIGFILHTALESQPWFSRRTSLAQIGINPAVFAAGVRLLSLSLEQARIQAEGLKRQANAKSGAQIPTAYQPSLLRLFPIISFGPGEERLRAPLRQLILLRVTAGLYYDLIKGPSHLRNEAAERFETYCMDFIASTMPLFSVRRSTSYRVRGNAIKGPDILVKHGGAVAIAIECKATKLTFAAQFAEDPLDEAEREYSEIAKGVFQLWRYFSHARRGIVTADTVRPDAHGVVLTLDTWLVMSRELQKQIFQAAEAMAAGDTGIVAEDRRKVVICPINDFEHTALMSGEEAFLRVLSAAEEDRFTGWMLPSIHRETEAKNEERKPFPFNLGDVLPWWDATGSAAKRE